MLRKLLFPALLLLIVPSAQATSCLNPDFVVSDLVGSVSNANQVEVVDFDGDGDTDVIVSSDSEVDFYWYENGGAGAFTQYSVSDSTVSDVDSIEIIDIENDGDLDVIVGASQYGDDANDGRVFLMINDGSQNFTSIQVGTLKAVKDLVAGDLDGDGDVDIAAVSYDSNLGVALFAEVESKVVWWENTSISTTTISFADSYTGIEDYFPGAFQLELNDLDEDGDFDLIVAGDQHLSPTGLRSYLNDSGTFTASGVTSSGGGPFAVFDLDEDGDQDIVRIDYDIYGTVLLYLYLNDGEENFTASSQTLTSFSKEINELIAKDFDDDGDVDLIVSDTDNGFGWLENDGSQVFSENVIIDHGDGHLNLGGADFNSDGLMDLLGVHLGSDLPSLMTQTCDLLAPSVSAFSPAAGATDIALDAHLSITFDEEVQIGTGNITIYDSSDSVVEVIDVTSGNVRGGGTSQITIIPTDSFDYASTYILRIDGTSFRDEEMNYYEGLSANTWSFTTEANLVTGVVFTSSGGGGRSSSSSNSDDEEVIIDDFEVELAVSELAIEFEDVAGHDNEEAIQYLLENGVVEGYDDGEYKPDQRINRAEFLKVLMEVRTSGELVGEGCFPDVNAEWFAKYVCTAKELGIIEGYGDGYFRPEQEINLAEALKIVFEAYEFDLPNTDIWYDRYLELAESIDVLVSVLSDVEDQISRGEMAQLIFNLQQNLSVARE